jgi:hypothetical protein
VLLATPGKSVILWAPALLLAAGGVRRAWTAHRALVVGLAVSFGLALLFYGSYFFPEGGYAHGPRHLVPLIPLLLLPAVFAGPAVLTRRSVMACGLLGALLALGSVSVSFLEDQAVGANLAHPRENYYQRVAAQGGKPWNRYNVGYLPFVSTLRSGGWGVTGPPGSGVDYFGLNLMRARRALPDCRAAIPAALPFTLLLVFGGMLLGGAAGLAARLRAWSRGSPERAALA